MKNELKLLKCTKCKAVVKVIENCENCNVSCCNEVMKEVVPNSVEASFEKHIPNYEIVEDEISVTLNHVMEKEHYIEWIALVFENKEVMVKLYPEQDACARFPYIKGSTLYAYCNNHGLWKSEVK